MKLLALLIGLAVERLATQLFHLRELRWLDRVIDRGFEQVNRFANWPPLLLVVLLAAVLVLPVALVRLALGDALFGFPYLLFAVFVLFFSFGPKDIGEEVNEYCAALESGDEDRIRRSGKALLERDPPPESAARVSEIEAAVCVQANNRLFAVIFWFILLGPLGAWAYRVTDLIRRRAVFKAARDESSESAASLSVTAAEDVHGWVAWIPARLAAVGYCLAGNFDAAIAAWRTGGNVGVPPGVQNENLLARVGLGALSVPEAEEESSAERGARGALAANKLVFRSLLIWTAVIAAMTLYGWSV
ncbi:MAG TPA: regulatory signaling modulator protein AmpE [Woeseiaceae bacterium]|nr:regulatory signaling modulator protein AmpE [Woeseiaceae bacterium]